MTTRKWFGINWADIENTTQAERDKILLNAGVRNQNKIEQINDKEQQ